MTTGRINQVSSRESESKFTSSTLSELTVKVNILPQQVRQNAEFNIRFIDTDIKNQPKAKA